VTSAIIASISALILLATSARAVTVATVGDSLADAVYLGMKLQPDLLKKNGIHLVRWSRAKIGLTRTDYFDYTDWLRVNNDLGTADFCVVQLGANDLQSISIRKNNGSSSEPKPGSACIGSASQRWSIRCGSSAARP
jgi:hypothetical protein